MIAPSALLLVALLGSGYLEEAAQKPDLRKIGRRGAEKFAASVKSTDFQTFEEGSEDVNNYVEALTGEKFPAGDARRKASSFLNRAIKSAVADAFEVRNEMVPTVPFMEYVSFVAERGAAADIERLSRLTASGISLPAGFYENPKNAPFI